MRSCDQTPRANDNLIIRERPRPSAELGVLFCVPNRRNVDRNLLRAIFDSLSVVKSDSVAGDSLDVSINLATAWRSAEHDGTRRAVRPLLTAWPPSAEPVQSAPGQRGNMNLF